jgi:vacuolar-type H+-ATPase subunit I/STV1
MSKPQGVHKVSENIVQLGRGVIYTEELDNIDMEKVPDGSIWVNVDNGGLAVKLRGSDSFTELPIGLADADDDESQKLLEEFVKKYANADIQHKHIEEDVLKNKEKIQELKSLLEKLQEQIHNINIYALYESLTDRFTEQGNEIITLRREKLDKKDLKLFVTIDQMEPIIQERTAQFASRKELAEIKTDFNNVVKTFATKDELDKKLFEKTQPLAQEKDVQTLGEQLKTLIQEVEEIKLDNQEKAKELDEKFGDIDDKLIELDAATGDKVIKSLTLEAGQTKPCEIDEGKQYRIMQVYIKKPSEDLWSFDTEQIDVAADENGAVNVTNKSSNELDCLLILM